MIFALHWPDISDIEKRPQIPTGIHRPLRNSVTYLSPAYNRWRFGSVGNVVLVGRINEVNQRRARLVLGWVTVCKRVNHLGM